jgi:ABC-type sugar transport system ATPase subunit
LPISWAPPAWTVGATDGDLRRLGTDDGFELWGVSDLAEGARAAACLRPDAVRLHEQAVSNQFVGEVVSVSDLGDFKELVVAIGPHRLRARSDASAAIAPGHEIGFHIDPQRCMIVEAEG